MNFKKLIYLATLCTIHQVAQSQQHSFSTQRLQQIVNHNPLSNNNTTTTSSTQNSSHLIQSEANKNRRSPEPLNSFTIMQLPQQIAIRLTLDNLQTNTPVPSPLTFSQPTTPSIMHLINQAITQQICLTPDHTITIENPITAALKKALQAMMPADATISLTYEPTFSSPKTSLSYMARCESHQQPSLHQVNIHTKNQNSFNLIKKRLIINNTIVPALQKFLIQKSSEYHKDLHDPSLLRLALTVRKIIRELINV